MKVLVIGGGGREHAIAWRLAKSPAHPTVITAPGNPGAAEVGSCVDLHHASPDSIVEFAKLHSPDFVVVGPEQPLVDGATDALRAQGIPVVGPSRLAAELEGSKTFAKRFMQRHDIPTAHFVAAENLFAAKAALESFGFPVVIKADGLAAGKGVVIAESKAHAEDVLASMFSGSFVGAAGSRVVIEEYLEGEELSFIALTDGERAIALEPSQDHKRLQDGDQGPNTGGMGAYSDSLILKSVDREEILRTIVSPTLHAMRSEGRPFQGFLYAGLMMTQSGPKVLEYNVRLGDPETQCLLHRFDGDLCSLLYTAAQGQMESAHSSFRKQPSVCVVVAAAGYPNQPRKGDVIYGLDKAAATGALVFHAGTRESNGRIVTNGGRVLGVTHSGATLEEAIRNCYSAVQCISFEGMQYRKDIGRKGLARYNEEKRTTGT